MGHVDTRATGESRQEKWNERYSAAERVWSATPNEHVAQIVDAFPPGRALDLGAGEGRHAIWLAERGWQVTAVDFAEAGLERGRREAVERGVADAITWVAADVTTWEPSPEPEPEREGEASGAYHLVLIAFLHVPEDVFARAVGWLAPGGRLVVVGHALRNLTDGAGGPQDPALLHSPEQLRDKAADLTIERLEEVERTTADGETAIDIVLVAQAPAL